jgi:hypothetical protein
MAAGLYAADLGGGLLKKGFPVQDKVKAADFARWWRPGNRWFFVFGFPKNERSNIDKDEDDALKRLAAYLLSMTLPALAKAQGAGELIEVDCDAEDKITNS